MWDAQIDGMDEGRVRRVKVLCDRDPVPYAEVLERWLTDDAFCSFFIAVLAQAPYDAFLWETPPITRRTAARAFEFVLVDSPDLARLPLDRDAFGSHFDGADAGAKAEAFANLGGDALLVAPVPQALASAYPHIAAFSRSAPLGQQRAFWRTVGSQISERLSDRPLWVSACGLGVAWLHVRLDTWPKYYTFSPYRRAPDARLAEVFEGH
jgi:hypothetical protein